MWAGLDLFKLQKNCNMKIEFESLVPKNSAILMKSKIKILSEHFMRFHIWKPALINHVKLHFKVWGERAHDKRIADAA